MSVLRSLIALLRSTYRLNWHGIHGVAHWARVRNNGLRLARTTGANLDVVECFAFLHDACRHSEGRDIGHGMRAAKLACAITVATCWDADRLDLGRVDIVPDPRYLHTVPGRDPATIKWAFERSVQWRIRYLARMAKR